MAPKAIAVIGGGITGLSAAFHLSKRFPRAQITIFERSNRIGGWINSRHVKVSDGSGHNATICLEAGPRTLRPNSKAMLELINQLHLQTAIISTPTTSPAARNRFIQIPGREGLTALPSSPLSFLRSPFLSSLIALPAAKEMFLNSNRRSPEDESVDEFMSRRFGDRFARIMGSALVHGIYAADSRVLSVRAAFPTLWDAEERGKGSVVRGFLRKRSSTSTPLQAYDVGDLSERMKGVSAFSFRGGMETLPHALATNVRAKQNVTIRSGVSIAGLRFLEEQPDAELELEGGETLKFSHVVSTVSLPKLQSITSQTGALPHMTNNPMSTVTVVNIIFPPTKAPIHPAGFGYLIPRPEGGYGSEANASGFLGTVFDSCALAAQDSGDAGFTKLTVMMGGPHKLDRHQSDPSHVLSHLAQHLGSSDALPEPAFYEAREQVDCIPTPTVGHVQRMSELLAVLRDPAGPWKGRLEVIGAGVGGVSVGDCVEAGRNAGSAWN
ncbi:Protoporphyrinogen oxidase [Schizopora paradoxa]|uniref:Protoporphyrinogen oxidase n=1 Tax=Schizopora paradoxa TaxID=27342 RepID=A0A0H2R575_9AGAM|nr:Protoporphyrinogen oxidase [Schizopora paradoxa]